MSTPTSPKEWGGSLITPDILSVFLAWLLPWISCRCVVFPTEFTKALTVMFSQGQA